MDFDVFEGCKLFLGVFEYLWRGVDCDDFFDEGSEQVVQGFFFIVEVGDGLVRIGYFEQSEVIEV